MDTTHKRTASQTPRIPSRPTTPLRPSSRTSLRSGAAAGFDPTTPSSSTRHGPSHPSSYPSSNPLAALEPAFAELADGFADLEANMMHVQLLHESVSRFSENFAAFLYGMNVNAFCVDFPEAPTAESFRRMRNASAEGGDDNDDDDGGIGDGAGAAARGALDPDVTIVSTATSFIDHPASASHQQKAGGRYVPPGGTPGRRGTAGVSRGREAAGAGRGRTGTSGATAARGASARGASTAGRGRASGIARGTSTARGRGGVR